MRPFISPLLLLFFVLAILWIGAFLRGGISFRARFGILFLGAVGALLYLSATPYGSEWLRASLPVVGPPPDGFEPESIVVLDGGMTRARTPDGDVLSSITARRVMEGVQQWKKFPQAQFILSGSGPDEEGRPAGHVTELMARFAVAQGVDEERIRIETASRNTRAHPIELRKSSLVRPDEAILVVTSDWHLPRAKGEFDRAFSNVQYAGASIVTSPETDWRRWLAGEGTLWESTLYVREWAGRVAYAADSLRMREKVSEKVAEKVQETLIPSALYED